VSSAIVDALEVVEVDEHDRNAMGTVAASASRSCPGRL
jgi:hypothetical protein